MIMLRICRHPLKSLPGLEFHGSSDGLNQVDPGAC